MLDRRRVLVFVMDPIESVDIDADTTFVLMLEAQRRGHDSAAATRCCTRIPRACR